MIGGAADLVESTKTVFEGGGEFSGVHAGRNVPFGIREHAMGAIVNGITLHYLRAFGATFFTFSDYMRGSVRLAALMSLLIPGEILRPRQNLRACEFVLRVTPVGFHRKTSALAPRIDSAGEGDHIEIPFLIGAFEQSAAIPDHYYPQGRV